MEALETVVIWALLLVSAGVMGLAVRATLNKMKAGLETSSAAPGVLGVAAGAVFSAVMLPQSAPLDIPFLVVVMISIVLGLVVGWLVKNFVANDAAGLGLAVVTTAVAVILAAVVGSPSKLIGFACVALVGIYVLGLMGFRSLPEPVANGLPWAGAAVTFIGLFDWLQAKVGSPDSRMTRLLQSPEMESVAATVWAVILAVGASTALFVFANLVFDRTDKHWAQFTTIAGAAIGFVTFGLLDGNRLLKPQLGYNTRADVAEGLHDVVNGGFWSLLIASIVIGAFIGYGAGYAIGVSRDDRTGPPMIGLGVGAGLGLVWGTLFAQRIPVDTSVNVLWTAVTGAVVCGLLGFAVGSITDLRTRAIVATVGGGAIGLMLGEMLETAYQPRLETVPLIVAPLAVAAIGAGVNTVRTNWATAAAVGGAIGVAIAIVFIDTDGLAARTAVTLLLLAAGAALAVTINSMRRRSVMTGAATGALIGWLLATFGIPTLGGGPAVETFAATGVAGALAGLRFGAKQTLDSVGRVNLEQKSRGVIFLIPALSFIAVGSVIPLIRTIVLSFKDERSEFWVGLENYSSIFTDPRSFDYTGRLNLFGSMLFWLAAALLVVAVVAGYFSSKKTGNAIENGGVLLRVLGAFVALIGLLEIVLRRQTADAAEVAQATDEAASGQLGAHPVIAIILLVIGLAVFLYSFRPKPAGTGGSSIMPKIDLAGAPGTVGLAGMFILSLAVFSTVRGTLFNNLWWVVTVTALSAGFGLAVAVLADRASYENVAKSFIFMPLAISFVGAGIIWRFMYIARDERKDQTGVMNFLWVELGKISTGGVGRVIGIVVLLAILAGLGWLIMMGLQTGARNTAISSAVFALPFLWALYRFTIGGGMGGVGTVTDNGVIQDTTIQFLPDNQPFNNLWLMLVLIWIQTGFAMVIFSAAIKAVDSSLIEAAKIDGANDSQVFWKVTVPQIAPTIGVVVTTLIVVVMKVFDIVKVMTNGNFDTQVVANEMWQRAFTELNTGLGSALAIVLFLAVVPVMAYNIRTMQKEL